MSFATLSGGNLYYEVTGEGQPLVLIHGLLMHSGLWDDQIAAFSQHYKVIRYDVSGFGKSPISPTADSDALLQLLTYLNVQRVYILGLSMGSEIALNFTLNHPDRVAGLVMVSPSLDDFPYSDDASQRWQNFITPVMARNFDEAREVFLRQVIDGPISPAAPTVREKARQLMASYTFVNFFPPELGDPQVEPNPNSAASTEDIQTEIPASLSTTERLHEIAVPTLVMVGDRDQPHVSAVADVLVKHIPAASKVIVQNAAHIINLEQPTVFTEQVLSFLQQADLAKINS
jgi:3-oxoadipate enol-lactonase